MKRLVLSENLNLPLDAATQTFGIFGRKGSGKTYLAGKLCELFLDAGIQSVVLDGVGNYYGLRLASDGQTPSRFNLPILGGAHGDVPLTAASGALVAEFIISTGTSAVLDVSRFRKHERKEFVTAFAEELFHRKKAHPSPLHFFLEEAQLFAPQKVFKGEERMLGALEDIVRLGRNYGIGTTMISQRPQSINTELRNQCEPLIIFQLVAKHERDAIGDWLEHMDVEADLQELARLKPGECFFWSPAWLEEFARIRCFKKESYDASATPKVGEKQREPRALAPVDLGALESAMAQVIENAKANDPAALKKRIAELERQLLSVQASPAAIDQGAIDRAIADAVRPYELRLDAIADHIAALEGIRYEVEKTADALRAQTGPVARPAADPVKEIYGAAERPHPIPLPSEWARGSEPKGNVEERILTALQDLYAIGVRAPERVQVAFFAGYSHLNSKGFVNAIGALRTKCYIDYPEQGRVMLTQLGKENSKPSARPRTAEELRGRVIQMIGGASARILQPLIDYYPNSMPRELLAMRANYGHINSKGFVNALGRLRSLGFIDYPKAGQVAAQPVLFLK